MAWGIARTTIIAMDAWVWIPFMVTLLLAGLLALGHEVKEAAKAGGARLPRALYRDGLTAGAVK
ncbi:MAG TPA: hypothetical protein VMB83_15850 [Roseiarcus sp.]|nr:hypothetical protein [Roseiarcus sp.]